VLAVGFPVSGTGCVGDRGVLSSVVSLVRPQHETAH